MEVRGDPEGYTITLHNRAAPLSVCIGSLRIRPPDANVDQIPFDPTSTSLVYSAKFPTSRSELTERLYLLGCHRHIIVWTTSMLIRHTCYFSL